MEIDDSFDNMVQHGGARFRRILVADRTHDCFMVLQGTSKHRRAKSRGRLPIDLQGLGRCISHEQEQAVSAGLCNLTMERVVRGTKQNRIVCPGAQPHGFDEFSQNL